MRHFAALAALLLSACTPCDSVAPGPGGLDAFTEVCWITTDVETTAADTTGDDSGGATDTGTLICDLTPGSPWGPCLDDGTCGKPGVFCLATGTGSVCAPACQDEECPDLGCDLDGVCMPTGACMPSCSDAADCVTGQSCDIATGMCVWPTPPPEECVPALGELWGACPDGACAEGQCTSGPDGETLCAPLCVGGDPCTPDACGPPSPAPICQTSGICGYTCDPEHPCDAGQTCVAQGFVSVCMWQ